MAFIPVVDFNVYKLGTSDVTDKNLQGLSKELRKAFTEVGFVYLKNTGIDQKEVCISILTVLKIKNRPLQYEFILSVCRKCLIYIR